MSPDNSMNLVKNLAGENVGNEPLKRIANIETSAITERSVPTTLIQSALLHSIAFHFLLVNMTAATKRTTVAPA